MMRDELRSIYTFLISAPFAAAQAAFLRSNSPFMTSSGIFPGMSNAGKCG